MVKPSFTDGPAFPGNAVCGVDAIPHIYAKNRNVFCVIARSNNGNVSVYEMVDDKPVNFWLDLDPATMTAARARGRTHDRDETSVMDRPAYGFTINEINGKRVMKIRSLPRPIVVIKGKNGYTGFTKINGHMCILKYIWVKLKPILGVVPVVEYIDIVGYDRVTKEKRSERVRK